jgi:two-component system chemotaxis response regulator CheB
MEALARGASDYVLKPNEERDLESALRTLLVELRPKIAALMVRQSHPPTQVSGQTSNSDRVKQTAPAEAEPARTEVIVIGVSTGGPVALERLLARLPADLPVPVLIVQHMPKLFTGALAQRLDRCCALRVREALEPGGVWLAPGAMHMKVVAARGSGESAGRDGEERVGARGAQICLHEGVATDYNRPSVDYLFRSAAKVYGAATMAAVLTGMGTDGLAGSRSIHEAGGTVLAQDEATSVVWGMPGRVTQAGIAAATLPLDSIAEELTRRAWIGRERKEDATAKRGARYNAAIGRAEAANVL